MIYNSDGRWFLILDQLSLFLTSAQMVFSSCIFVSTSFFFELLQFEQLNISQKRLCEHQLKMNKTANFNNRINITHEHESKNHFALSNNVACRFTNKTLRLSSQYLTFDNKTWSCIAFHGFLLLQNILHKPQWGFSSAPSFSKFGFLTARC